MTNLRLQFISYVVDHLQEFVIQLELQPEQEVLDIGAGIGGSAFYMAKTFDVRVHGIDLSTNMIEIAIERAERYKDPRVCYYVFNNEAQLLSLQMEDVLFVEKLTSVCCPQLSIAKRSSMA